MRLQAYFQAYRNYFWQWEDHTEVIAIPNGSTIAYKAFVLEVLEYISPTGTPPFGALLFMLIATNPTAKNDLEHIKGLLKKVTPQKENNNSIEQQAFDFFIKVEAIHPTYKTGNKRIQLLQTIFKNSHNHLSLKKATQILREHWQHKEKFPHLIQSQEKPFNSDALYKDFRVFRQLNAQFPTSQSILDAIADLPDIDANILEDTNNTSIDILLEQLTENIDTFFVATLIKHLWSGLNLPFKQFIPNQQPLGGISDITNKGNFDRLLISEFAYDDLSFLSRLANNEALYLQREAPPSSNYLERVVLIDVSLKNWGTPKTIAYAILLALAYHPKNKTNCKAFAVGGRLGYQSIAFHSIDAIIDSLQLIDASLDCSSGLSDFLKKVIQTKQTEIIYIGVQEASKSSDFKQAINSFERYFQFWIHPNSTGQIKVYKNQKKVKKHLQTIQLPLEKLWEKPTKLIQPNDKVAHCCPILIPQPSNYKQILSTTDDQVFMVNLDKSLLWFGGIDNNYNQKGWELMYERLPFSSGVYEIGLMSDGSYVLLVLDLQNKTLSLINCQTKVMKQTHFEAWAYDSRKEFLFYNDVFYYVAQNTCWSVDFYAKKMLTTVEQPTNFFELYDDRRKELGNLTRQVNYLNPTPSILKNIKTVEINKNGQLVFNKKHTLLLNPYGVIKLELSVPTQQPYSAINILNKHIFSFKDGSEVHITSLGVITLNSSDRSLPTIYVPMTIDAALGIGTKDCFAGNDYYKRSSNSGSSNIMNTQKFWETFIQPFIETIQSHV